MSNEDLDNDFDETTPKAGILTISQEDAQALHDFEVFVGGDCFDVWDRDGTRSKSDLLMKHLARIRAVLAEIGEDRTISQDGAKAIHDFDNFVGRDCFDVPRPNGARSKSLPLMKHMDRMREVMNKLMDYPEVETGFYTAVRSARGNAERVVDGRDWGTIIPSRLLRQCIFHSGRHPVRVTGILCRRAGWRGLRAVSNTEWI
ncbi:hypothetical protein FHT86_000871 [Rhizobium sp. BK313]|uniref:hypothetical protein n=1 Tax=Rhizobium sp. BK313 TaxID=2587081 RepID=UPI00105E2C0B|nr:hypothetical protein [Rhizobium sp. BK313]MBB3452615.1 hypothetical protein [Rhizobium sp. BK313]